MANDIVKDDISSKTRLYTDVQGLKQLQYSKDTRAARKEVAQQFEAMFMQLVLRNMRDATKSFSSGMFGSNQMSLYQDLFDKQMTLMMSNSGIGLAEMFEKNMERFPGPDETVSTVSVPLSNYKTMLPVDVQAAAPETPALDNSVEQTVFASAEEFIKKLWPMAKTAANVIGVNPALLIAQAALETNWGKNVLGNNEASSYNLFNIKASLNWQKKTTTVNTLEQKNGVLIKEQARFKNYDSYKESFMDYIGLLQNNTRYHNALTKAADPEGFMQAVHQAGYATDPHYSDKVLKIFSSKMFQNLVAKLKNI